MKERGITEKQYSTILKRLLEECDICYLQFFDMASEEFYEKFNQYIIPDYIIGPNLKVVCFRKHHRN